MGRQKAKTTWEGFSFICTMALEEAETMCIDLSLNMGRWRKMTPSRWKFRTQIRIKESLYMVLCGWMGSFRCGSRTKSHRGNVLFTWLLCFFLIWNQLRAFVVESSVDNRAKSAQLAKWNKVRFNRVNWFKCGFTWCDGMKNIWDRDNTIYLMHIAFTLNFIHFCIKAEDCRDVYCKLLSICNKDKT